MGLLRFDYIDIETTKQGKIKDLGALFNGQEAITRKRSSTSEKLHTMKFNQI